MKNIIPFLMALIILSSCGETSDQAQQKSIKVDYQILSETDNPAANKCNINIELPEKISQEKLTTIAEELRSTRKSYDKLWIFYYLPGMKIDAGAWATSHFTPDLKVEFVGANMEQEAKIKENTGKVDGKILGKFYEQQFGKASYTVYEKNNKTFMQIIFDDGSSSDGEMKKKNVATGIRLTDKISKGHGEYFILTKSNVLEFYNAEDRMFTTAIPIE